MIFACKINEAEKFKKNRIKSYFYCSLPRQILYLKKNQQFMEL